MGPHIPLNFFMTRLLFMEKDKVDSLKAKSDKAQVEIIVDNPKILKESEAKSLPPAPFPPAAPESPHPVEGWKGLKVGGWIRNSISGRDSNSNAASAYHGGNGNDATGRMSKLSLHDDDEEGDHTSTTEESSATFEVTPAISTGAKPAADRPMQLFPANSARSLNVSNHAKKSCSSGSGSSSTAKKSKQRPSLRKKSFGSKNSGSLLKLAGSSSKNDKDSSGESSSGEE